MPIKTGYHFKIGHKLIATDTIKASKGPAINLPITFCIGL